MKALQLFSFIFLFIISISLNAQDIHFSQFWNAPLVQNPSFAGKSDGDFRCILNHRSQWNSLMSSPFKSVGLDTDFRIKAGLKDSYLGFGISVYSDVAGTSQHLTTLGNLTTAYHLKINQNNYISAGIQGGFYQLRNDGLDLRFDNQFEGTGHNPEKSHNENLNQLAELAPTISAGVSYMWSNEFGKTHYKTFSRKRSFNIGIAIHHFNGTKMTFVQKDYSSLKLTTTLEGSLNTTPFWNLKPSVYLAFQNKAYDVVFGSLFVYKFNTDTNVNKEFSLGIGSYFRLNDALIPAFQIQYDSFLCTFSYDVNISQLSYASNNRGGAEISLAYVPLNLFMKRKSKARFF